MDEWSTVERSETRFGDRKLREPLTAAGCGERVVVGVGRAESATDRPKG